MFPVYENSKEKEKRLKLFKLVQCANKVILTVVDQYGDSWSSGNILEITSQGKLYLWPGISSEIGLKTNDKGKIIVDNP